MMHTDNLSPYMHDHVFDLGNPRGERGTRMVMWITAAMMVIEVAGGWWLNSMALLADGWHMSSHAIAIGLSAFAYTAARRYQSDRRFAFGTWKIEVLAGFASAILLLGIAVLMGATSLERLAVPQPIHYVQAIPIAVVGLIVNIVCALILGSAHRRDHVAGHDHHEQAEHPHDLNLKSAYVHVAADAATSVLAIIALTGGLLLGWGWLDSVMGIVGAAVVAAWAWGLLKQTSRVLLDGEMDHPVVHDIRDALESPSVEDGLRVTDLHVWRVGRQSFAAALTVVTHDATLTATRVREMLAVHQEVAHATIEIQRCHQTPEG